MTIEGAKDVDPYNQDLLLEGGDLQGRSQALQPRDPGPLGYGKALPDRQGPRETPQGHLRRSQRHEMTHKHPPTHQPLLDLAAQHGLLGLELAQDRLPILLLLLYLHLWEPNETERSCFRTARR